MAAHMAWTEERKTAFLKALRAHGGNLSAAAAEVTPHSSTQAQPGYTSAKYAMRADPSFALAVEEVMEGVKADVYAEIYRRAMNGVLEPVIQKGEQARMADGSPAFIRRLDNRLLLRLAGRLDPDWQERRTVDITHRKAGTVTLELADLAVLDSTDRQQLTGILTKVREARSGQHTSASEQRAIEHHEVVEADYELVTTGEAQNAAEAPLHPWEGTD